MQQKLFITPTLVTKPCTAKPVYHDHIGYRAQSQCSNLSSQKCQIICGCYGSRHCFSRPHRIASHPNMYNCNEAKNSSRFGQVAVSGINTQLDRSDLTLTVSCSSIFHVSSVSCASMTLVMSYLGIMTLILCCLRHRSRTSTKPVDVF